MFDWNQFLDIAESLSRKAFQEPNLSEACYRIGISRTYYSVLIQVRDKLKTFGFEFPEENTHTLVKIRVSNNFISRDRDKKNLWRIAKDDLVSLCAKRKDADYVSDEYENVAKHYDYAKDEAENVINFLNEVVREDFNLDC